MLNICIFSHAITRWHECQGLAWTIYTTLFLILHSRPSDIWSLQPGRRKKSNLVWWDLKGSVGRKINKWKSHWGWSWNHLEWVLSLHLGPGSCHDRFCVMEILCICVVMRRPSSDERINWTYISFKSHQINTLISQTSGSQSSSISALCSFKIKAWSGFSATTWRTTVFRHCAAVLFDFPTSRLSI